MSVAVVPDVARLASLEDVIERGLSSFCEVGNALMAIRDGRLYHDTHQTFEAYCKERWGFSDRRARQLMSAASSAEIVNRNNCSGPVTESQARPLTGLPPEEQAEAWEEVVETAPEGKITAKHVQEVVDRVEARKENRRLPKYKEPENGWVLGSQAMNHAGSAILQLERISKDDPERKKAFKRVTDWIKNQLTEGGGSSG